MAFLNETGLERLWAHILAKVGAKVDKVDGKGLSTNDYTDEDKNKILENSEAVNSLNTLVGDKSVSEQINDALLNNQADLSQTDETAPGYIKGMIRKESLPDGYPYIAEVTILPETSLIDGGEGMWLSTEQVLEPFSGENYTVVYNGVEYTTLCVESETGPVLGNIGALEGGEDTGEPFVVLFIPKEMSEAMGGATIVAMPLDGPTEIALSIRGKGIEKIAEKYLPKLWSNNILDGWSEGSVRTSMSKAEDDIYVMGDWAFAEGYGTVASGSSSHAEGEGTTASGISSHAEGEDTVASSISSHAEGYKTIASGMYSHAEGRETTASGQDSHAEGQNTTASGYNSHAEGRSTKKANSYITESSTNDEIITAWTSNKFLLAKGENSHASGKDTLALGSESHAEGQNTTASGQGSHAEGKGTTASGYNSHAEGLSTTASGTYSHAEGQNTTASGISSHAEGSGTIASNSSSHAEGVGTQASGGYAHAEGFNTTASSLGSHAEGHKTIASGENSHAEGNDTEASGTESHAEGFNTTASGTYSHAEGEWTTASGNSSHAEGQNTTASGFYSHAEGSSTSKAPSIFTNASNDAEIIVEWENTKFLLAKGINSHASGRDTLALGRESHTEGWETIASGFYSHAEGERTVASGINSHVEGYKTIASGENSHAEGNDTEASGRCSHAEGSSTEASGLCSHTEGAGTTASSDYSHAEGFNTTASGTYSHVQGKYNIEDSVSKYAHIVGNGTSSARSNAHTLDWDGNAWFAGNIKVGGTGQDDTAAIEVALKSDLDTLITVDDIDTICNANIEYANLDEGAF